MTQDQLSPIWIERVIEKHRGPAAEVLAHFRALGLPPKRAAAALRAWAARHNVTLDERRLGIEPDN